MVGTAFEKRQTEEDNLRSKNAYMHVYTQNRSQRKR